MRIKRLEIYGYGKWVDQTFEINQNLQVFYGQNEAGKSTLMSFIHSILFGFPTRSSTLLRYEPHGSSKYGGKIIVEDRRFGEVAIERVHGKVTGDVTVTLEDGTTGNETMLNTLLSGMTRETFQQIFSFSLTDIEEVHQLSKDQLSRYLLNIGAHGTDRYLDLADELTKDADKIYRPTGRVLPLNKKLAAIEKQEQRLNELEKKNAGYLTLLETHAKQVSEIEKLESEEEAKKDELAQLLEQLKEWHVVEEMNQLSAEIEQMKLPPLKEDGKILFDEYKKELQTTNLNLQETQLALYDKQKELSDPEVFFHLEQNQETIQKIEDALPEMLEYLNAYHALTKERAADEKRLSDLAANLKLIAESSKPASFSEREKRELREWTTVFQEQQMKSETLGEEVRQLEKELELKNQKLDQLEAMMWDNAQFKEVEAELEQVAKPAESASKMPALLTAVAGITGIVGSFFLNPPLQWVVLGIGVLLLVLAGIWGLKKEPISEKSNTSKTLLQSEYSRQQNFKEQWRDGLIAVDVVQEKLHEKKQFAMSVQQNQQIIEDNWVDLLGEHDLPQEFSYAEWHTVVENTNAFVSLTEVVHKQEIEITHLDKKLEELTVPILELLEMANATSYAERLTAFRTFLTETKQRKNTEEKTLEAVRELQREMKNILATKEQTKQKMQTLIEMADAKDEVSFYKVYQQKESRDAKVSRLTFLKENAPSFDGVETFQTKEMLQEKEAQLRQIIVKVTQQHKKNVMELANTQLSIEHVEQDGTYSEELQQFENQKAATQRLLDEWVSYKLAAGLIQKTLNQVTKERFNEIISDAETYFHLLTDAEYEKIVFKEEALFVQHKDGQVVDVRVLSRGTAEPLYVAIRLAYIKNTQTILEIPVIMDDPFVNFDRARQKNMLRLMQELSGDMQLIYFTFDERTMEDFDAEQIIQLNEN